MNLQDITVVVAQFELPTNVQLSAVVYIGANDVVLLVILCNLPSVVGHYDGSVSIQ
jgi:hypothetical protein